ncbi:MAG: YcxB family protein [Oscillospiraceae bacterium]|nr:YcxB family protein [Oscillospiraceae bacterium]
MIKTENEIICPAEITLESGRTPLFTVNSPYDLETVCFLGRRIGKMTVISEVVSLILSAVSAIMGFYLITIVSGIFFLSELFAILSARSNSEKIYERFYKDENMRLYSFYDEHFSVRSSKGAAFINYDTLKKIVFDKNYILFLMPNGTNYVIAGNKIDHADLIDFLKSKAEKLKGK